MACTTGKFCLCGIVHSSCPGFVPLPGLAAFATWVPQQSLNSMCRARHCFFYKPDCCSEYKQIDPATFQNKQSGGFTSKECHLTSSTDSTKRHACLKMCKGPFFGGVIVLSHQASQLGMKLVMAQARPSNQRLSPGGEVLHSRHRFGRQHFEVIVVLTVKGQTLSSSPIRFACVLQRPTHRYSTMAPCALAADAASPRNRYYSAARKACTTFIARSACEQLNSVNDPTMNNSVSKKSSDIPMLPDKARCPHACVWCTQLLLETNAAQGPRHQSEAAWTRCAR